MLKKTIQTLMMGALMMALPFLFTSCEDILGHWEKPTPASPSVEELLTNLSAALEEGALVTITYTVDGVTYTSTFKKVGDEYVEQSTTAASRALTRAGEPEIGPKGYMKSILTPTKRKALEFRVNKGTEVVLDVQINTDDCQYTTNYAQGGSQIAKVDVNGKQADINTSYDLSVEIKALIGGPESYLSVGTIYYKEDEDWYDVCDRLSDSGVTMLQVDVQVEKVFYTYNVPPSTIYKDEDLENPVHFADQLSDVTTYYIKPNPIEYREFTLNETGTAIDDVDPYRETYLYKYLTSSNASVTLQPGTYAVKDNVTIDGNITLDGNVNLILCDGAKLTVYGEINGGYNSLTIYGQSQGDDAGNLVVVSDDDGLIKSDLTIHGGNITVNCFMDGIYNTPITVYGGKLSVKSTEAYAIYTIDKSMTVYGGDVYAISEIQVGILLGRGVEAATLTIYGGKVTAQGGKGESAIKGPFAAGEGSNIGFYGRNDSNDAWTQITDNTSDSKYFYAGADAPNTPAAVGLNE